MFFCADTRRKFMRIACTLLMTAALASACASAQAPRAAIADSEPDVTEHVAGMLQRVGRGGLSAEPLTENARAAFDAVRTDQLAKALRACAEPGKLELLERNTKGEERQYLYRAPCAGKPLLVEIYFGKGARISHLNVRPQ
jgi:hypothetical protein